MRVVRFLCQRLTDKRRINPSVVKIITTRLLPFHLKIRLQYRIQPPAQYNNESNIVYDHHDSVVLVPACVARDWDDDELLYRCFRHHYHHSAIQWVVDARKNFERPRITIDAGEHRRSLAGTGERGDEGVRGVGGLAVKTRDHV
jgi:hypothetical protein